MNDADCVAFLQWALPRLGLHWPGFRKVRGQVCKRIARRCSLLALPDVATYRDYLQAHPAEWEALRGLCAVAVSRFYRDREVFAHLEHKVLPKLASATRARPDRTLACWSAGCASGEEPYTVSILWQLRLATRFPGVSLPVLATDVDPVVLGRAVIGRYPWSSIKDLPAEWRAQAFDDQDGDYRLREQFRMAVQFVLQDIRHTVPQRRFDLVLCRNLVLTYFEPDLRREVMRRILATLRPGGALVVGIHESPTTAAAGLIPWPDARAVFRKVSNGDEARDTAFT